MISAEIITDSINDQGNRLTTYVLRYPKFIHGEFMTHRRFSRNASSSRAIPVAKMVAEVASGERAMPVFWGKNQPGMQAAIELDGYELETAKHMWAKAAMSAARFAQDMEQVGMHKQLVNRVLEPFLHINVVCSATEYMNFFGLRLDKGAQPEMRALTLAMWNAYSKSVPKKLMKGQWHLPFVEHLPNWENTQAVATAIKVSVARCARVSYMSNDTGKISGVGEDLILYDRLVGAQPMHASPAEHQAAPDTWYDHVDVPLGEDHWGSPELHGNFTGWMQFRKSLPGENCAPLPLAHVR